VKRDLLIELIRGDDQDLLHVKSSNSPQSIGDRLVSSFQEINDFIREARCEPHENKEDIREYSLWSRLNSFRENTEHSRLLTEYDVFNVLKTPPKIASIEDIFKNDDLGLLTDWSNDIFTLKHIRKSPAAPDYIAERKPCSHFHQFEDLFKHCQAALASGKRKLLPFANEQQIEAGDFFVLKGVLTYVAAVGQKELINGKTNARLYCIFENGTESDMLLRSLARELYKDGKRVTTHEDLLLKELEGIQEDDRETGYIYVLKSLSQQREILNIGQLYKIGFSRIPIEERIKNAAQEPTYLMAPVSVIASYKCFNLNPQKLEFLLHRFFANACLNISVSDRAGVRHTPREWFVAPLQVINQAIEFLISGDIVNYRYDHNQQEIVGRE